MAITGLQRMWTAFTAHTQRDLRLLKGRRSPRGASEDADVGSSVVVGEEAGEVTSIRAWDGTGWRDIPLGPDTDSGARQPADMTALPAIRDQRG
jgi:hypothetical protein